MQNELPVTPSITSGADKPIVTPEIRDTEFAVELRTLLNRHSRENGSNTPDYLLAGYLIDCLAAYDRALTARDKWFGIEPWKR